MLRKKLVTHRSEVLFFRKLFVGYLPSKKSIFFKLGHEDSLCPSLKIISVGRNISCGQAFHFEHPIVCFTKYNLSVILVDRAQSEEITVLDIFHCRLINIKSSYLAASTTTVWSQTEYSFFSNMKYILYTYYIV